jgi:hypothetical protein
MKIDTVDFSTSKQTFRLAAAQAPDSVALDPEVWTLMRSTFRKR